MINVQVTQGRPETQALELLILENHPEHSAAGPCRVCEPLNMQPVAAFGVPPFHPNCVCTVSWREAK